MSELMQGSENAFNGDGFIKLEFLKLQDKGFDTVIETGSFEGITTEWLADNFSDVCSIEINSQFYYKVVLKLIDKCPVLYGDSAIWLNQLIPRLIDTKVIFFLDSHWGSRNPLQGELQAICRGVLNGNLLKENIAIAIHDFYNPNHPEYQFDSYPEQEYTFPAIKRFIDAIFGKDGYDYYYNEESEGAKVGIIYIVGK